MSISGRHGVDLQFGQRAARPADAEWRSLRPCVASSVHLFVRESLRPLYDVHCWTARRYGSSTGVIALRRVSSPVPS
jgi:hypothetical protein